MLLFFFIYSFILKWCDNKSSAFCSFFIIYNLVHYWRLIFKYLIGQVYKQRIDSWGRTLQVMYMVRSGLPVSTIIQSFIVKDHIKEASWCWPSSVPDSDAVDQLCLVFHWAPAKKTICMLHVFILYRLKLVTQSLICLIFCKTCNLNKINLFSSGMFKNSHLINLFFWRDTKGLTSYSALIQHFNSL